MRQRVVHYRLKRHGGKFELIPLRWKPKRGKVLLTERCRRCKTQIVVWGRTSEVVAKAERKCCGGEITIVLQLQCNHSRTCPFG